MSFEKLGLSPRILRAIEDSKYTEPSPIQKQAIPMIKTGCDLIACAQTGTGKTAAFSLPLIDRIAGKKEEWRRTTVLVLSPTRELASQIVANIEQYSKYVAVRVLAIYGGVGMDPQVRSLRKGVQIVVATPGRLLDHLRQRTIDLSEVETLVLDEADNMLDMGFIHDVRRIMEYLPKKRQTLLFSATFSPEIKSLASEILDRPEVVQVARENAPVEIIDQVVHPVDRVRRRELLSHLIGREDWRQVLVFTRTKHGANRLSEQLNEDGLDSMAIHGNKSQGARNRALESFKSGKTRVLVATDIAARGIDIHQLPYVVNFDMPQVAENYVHRIGRTGRAGRTGKAVSLVCIDDNNLLRAVERLLCSAIPKVVLPGYEPDPTIPAQPVKDRRHSSSRGGFRNGPTKGGATRRPQQGRRSSSR